MSKIKPTSILPYTKTDVPAVTSVKVVNTSNALSAKVQPKAPLVKDLFRVLYAAADHNEYIKSTAPTLSSNLGAAVSAWRKRKL